MSDASPSSRFLAELASQTARAFVEHRRLLSFEEFLDAVAANPRQFARNSAQYLLDAIEAGGITDTGSGARRYDVFSDPRDGRDERVVGQEQAQADFVRVLRNFVRERRVHRLVLLHGPNGSAKSSFVSCLMRALEAYSQTDAGALYRFVWVFPSARSEGRPMGFGGPAHDGGGGGSFAHLPEDLIDVKLPAEQHDNPLFLLPRPDRQRFIDDSLAGTEGFVLSDTIRHGDLGPRSRAVFDALLAAYRGDLQRVYRHVQVERFFISRRFRRGAVTVEPQLHVDAGARQITVDRSLGSLPPVLQAQTLFEPHGPLVDGNRGIIEYSDLLKRQAEANKYLLATSEKGTVALDFGELHLDAVLVATANESYLEAFKQGPDWASYKGRTELVRMPYLLDFVAEQTIYDALVERLELPHAPAPHTTWIVALWAVLTRLRRPDAERFARPARELVAGLTPVQKAWLYAGLEPGGVLTGEQRRELARAVPQLRRDASEGAWYEGRVGASAREMKALLLNALGSADGLDSPRAVFAELDRLVRDTSLYEWLRIDPDGEFLRPDRFVTTVRDLYLDRVEREARLASGLVEESEVQRLFERYVQHANAWLRQEKLHDAALGRLVDADEALLNDVEKKLGREGTAREFRNGLIARVAAFRIDNPTEAVELVRIFPHLVDTLRDDYFGSRRREVAGRCRAALSWLDEGCPDGHAEAAQLVERLGVEFGYRRTAARAALAMLCAARYRDVH